MRDAIEGQDFIIDHYAVLGVARDATAKQVRAAYQKIMKENHPDLLVGRSAEILSLAQRRTTAASRSFEVIGNAAKRAAYDEQLAAWSGVLSTSGDPMVLLEPSGREIYELSTPEGKKALADQIQHHTRLHPDTSATVDALRAAYEASDDSPQLRAALDQALAAQGVHLAVRAITTGMAIGMRLHGGEAPLTEAKAALAGAQSSVEAMLAIEGTEHLAIGPGPTTEPSEKALAVRTAALDAFHAHADEVLRLAAEREEIMKQRLAFVKPVYVARVDDKKLSDKLVVFMRHNGAAIGVFAWDAKSGDVDSLDSTVETDADLKAWTQQGYDVAVFDVDSGLPLVEHLKTVIKAHHAGSLPSARLSEQQSSPRHCPAAAR